MALFSKTMFCGKNKEYDRQEKINDGDNFSKTMVKVQNLRIITIWPRGQ